MVKIIIFTLNVIIDFDWILENVFRMTELLIIRQYWCYHNHNYTKAKKIRIKINNITIFTHKFKFDYT